MAQLWIKFRCVYCGQLIHAPATADGKKGRCPRCKHAIRVISPERQAKLRAKLAIRPKPPAYEPYAPGAPDKTLLDAIHYLTSRVEPVDEQPPPNAFIRWARQIFIPTYSELSLFLMSITAILLLVSCPDLRRVLLHFSRKDPRGYVLMALVAAGIFFSIYSIFSNKPHRVYQLHAMLLFAVAANAFTGITAGRYMLEQSSTGPLAVFPVWNIINAGYLLLLFRFGGLTIRNISSQKSSALQLASGTLIAVAIFAVANYSLRLHWAVTFSICVAYATGFSTALQEVLFPVTRQLDRFS